MANPESESVVPDRGQASAAALSPVSQTALAVARVRAYESAQPRPLFTDPYALDFVSASGMHADTAGPDTPLARFLVAGGILRTRHYDDQLSAAGSGQVVLLAAGLDTRAFRLPWPPGTRLFELDLPPVLAFKERVLTKRGAVARCDRTAVPADLADPDWPRRLLAAGLDPTRPTAWLAEGLLVYLTAEQAAALLTAVGDLAAAGSTLLLEQGRDVSAIPREDGLARMTDLWLGGLGAATGDWLGSHGWDVEFTALDEVAARYGRPLPPSAGLSGSGYLRARRTAG